MTQPAHRRVFGGKIREQTEGEVQQLEDHVEEGEILGLAAEQLPGGGPAERAAPPRTGRSRWRRQSLSSRPGGGGAGGRLRASYVTPVLLQSCNMRSTDT